MDDLFEFISSILIFAVGGVLGLEFSRLRYRPRVNIRYEDVAPLYSNTGTFWSVKVINIGRTAATECACVMTIPDIEKEDLLDTTDASAYEDLPEYPTEDKGAEIPRPQILSRSHYRPVRTVSLCWARLGNPAHVNVNPGTTETIDVCKIEKAERQTYFIFPSENGWRQLRTRIYAKPLWGRILVCPSNEFPTQLDFKIQKDQNGQYAFSVHPPTLKRGIMTRLRKSTIYDA